MRRRHILLSYAILLLLIAGCGRNEEKLFPFEDFRRLEGRAVCEDMLVGRPSRLTVIDSLLIFSDKLDDRLVTIANPKSGESRRAVFTGRGPGEMMMIRRIYRDDDGRIFLFDINTHKIISYSADKSYQELLSPNTRLGETAFSYDEVPYEVITFGDGYIANGNFDGRQFSLFDGDGRSTGYFGVYPGNNDDVGSGDAFFMKNQTLMAVKPDQSRFAAAGYSNDQLVFYKAEKSGIPQKAREYFSYDSNIEVMGNEHGTRAMHTPETRSAYLCLYPTDKYLYASYNGRTIAEMTVPDASKDIYILKFDWDGKFIEGYVVGNIDDFAVDETAGRLYAFVYEDGDNILTAYDL